MVFKGSRPGTFTISNMETEEGVLLKLTGLEAKVIVDKLHGSVMDGRRINVVMTCLTTPNKIKKREVINLDETPEGDASVEEIARVSAKDAKAAADKKAEEVKRKKAEAEKKTEADKRKAGKKKAESEPAEATATEGNEEANDDPTEKTPEGDPTARTPEGPKVPKMQLAAIFTKGGSKTHAVRMAGAKSAREDSSESEAGSPELKGSKKTSPTSSKQDKKKKKNSHNNF